MHGGTLLSGGAVVVVEQATESFAALDRSGDTADFLDAEALLCGVNMRSRVLMR